MTNIAIPRVDNVLSLLLASIAVLPDHVLFENERVLALKLGDALFVEKVEAVRREEDQRQDEDKGGLVDFEIVHGLEELYGLEEDLLGPD